MLRSLAAGSALLAGVLLIGAAPAAADPEAAFLTSVHGRWVGPGEIVAGKYEGTKFVCDLSGAPHQRSVGLSLDGSCRVGIFAQKMSADISRGKGGLTGSFLDGADGAGLDIIAGGLDGDRMVFTLDRKQLNGAMVARLDGRDTMNVTISVRVGTELVPVIGMNLKREGAAVRQTALGD